MALVFLPGNSAVPGYMWPGYVNPGQPVLGDTQQFNGYLFTAGETLIYPQYLDGLTMKTLVAVPGNAYIIIPVGGNPGLALPPDDDGTWIA